MDEDIKKKKCSSCRKIKSLDMFCSGGGKYGKHSQCRSCRKLARFGQAPHQIEVKDEEV